MADHAGDPALPVIDLSRLNGGEAARAGLLDAVRAAARGPGFFYLAGHGVPSSLIGEAAALSRRFFALPEADKLAVEMVKSPHFRGYNKPGLEYTRGEPDLREQLDIGAEREPVPQAPGLPAWTRLQGPNQWPAALPELKDVLLRYQEAVTALAVRLIRLLAVALGQAADVFDRIYTPAPQQLLKIIRYPVQEAAGRQGVGAHKDSGFVTVLLQDEHAGLQVEVAGEWIDAPPIPGTFVVNIGEILELASNGYLKATNHRVLSPFRGGDRLSIAFFLGARLDATVPVLDLPPALAAQARGLTQDPLNPLFHEVGRNYLKGRLRSHPDVARRWYADLADVAPSLAGAA